MTSPSWTGRSLDSCPHMWPADGAEDPEPEPLPLHLAILEALFGSQPAPVVIALVVALVGAGAVLLIAVVLALW